MSIMPGKYRNPELEAIRNSVQPPPSNDAVVENLVHKTKDIHVSFLFGPEGINLRREICLSLSSTEQNTLYCGWEDFGHTLGLNTDLIGVFGCKYNFQDPTYNILSAYAQKENATLCTVIKALKKIGRADVIQKTCDLFSGLADAVHQKFRTSNESGYMSLSEGTVESSSELSEDDIQPVIIKSPYIPRVPDIYKSGTDLVQNQCTAVDNTVFHAKEEQQLVAASPNPVIKKSPTPESKYGIKVMLTFAADGYEAAQEVAKILRLERNELPRIGVLILQEQISFVTIDDQLFISGCFSQVDYVIPILTTQYLNSVTSLKSCDGNTCIDSKYVRYIYSLLNTNFLTNGCLNKKCRCIIPDELVHSVLQHPILRTEPLFKVWKKQSETDTLGRMLLNAKLGTRKTVDS